MIFIGDRQRGFRGSDVGVGSKGGGACGGTVGDSFLSCASAPKTSAVKLLLLLYSVRNLSYMTLFVYSGS